MLSLTETEGAATNQPTNLIIHLTNRLKAAEVAWYREASDEASKDYDAALAAVRAEVSRLREKYPEARVLTEPRPGWWVPMIQVFQPRAGEPAIDRGFEIDPGPDWARRNRGLIAKTVGWMTPMGAVIQEALGTYRNKWR